SSKRDWSSDVCSSDLALAGQQLQLLVEVGRGDGLDLEGKGVVLIAADPFGQGGQHRGDLVVLGVDEKAELRVFGPFASRTRSEGEDGRSGHRKCGGAEDCS